MNTDNFNYRTGERFADIELLRYHLKGWQQLTLRQKQYIYCLAKATLYGRDITFDQFGRKNLKIRRTLEAVCQWNVETSQQQDSDAQLLTTYLKRVWFSNGIYHHYGAEKFMPGFSADYLWQQMQQVPASWLPLSDGQSMRQLFDEIRPYIFDPKTEPRRVNKADGDDLIATSAVTFYDGVTQQEAEAFYAARKQEAKDDLQPESFGLNTTLVKAATVAADDKSHNATPRIVEQRWCAKGKYGAAIRKIVFWLRQATQYAENEQQQKVISLLCDYYETGDLKTFNRYCTAWVQALDGQVDFVNGFIEVYNDPLGLKGSWEGIVEYVDQEATGRTELISRNAQWFEDHSPVDERFRKPVVKGVSARVVRAAMLGGDEYPSTAIGINLPNADWIRAQYGSKSVTISNLTEAYDQAARGNGFKEEFIPDESTRQMVYRWGDLTDDIHTDLHECLGHGSGQLLPDTDPDALKAYGNTIEEARADLFALYYIADRKMTELGLLPSAEAYKASYYTYLLNGCMTQLTRIKPGHNIEEAHMRNRALIARWVLAHADGAAELTKLEADGRKTITALVIHDYPALRLLFGQLLREIQRIKSEGDYAAARLLVEQYAISVEPELHREVLQRYEALNLAPYKGFLNPRLLPVRDSQGNITDIAIDYGETYYEQMLRYSRQYATLI